MIHDSRRVTLVSRRRRSSERLWNRSRASSKRVVLLDSFSALREALLDSLHVLQLDVERVILDRNATPAEFLTLLSDLPQTFSGDVILIRSEDRGFLSAGGRGGDRVLYSMTPADLRFYLEAHALAACVSVAEQAGTTPAFEDMAVLQYVN